MLKEAHKRDTYYVVESVGSQARRKTSELKCVIKFETKFENNSGDESEP